MKEREALKLALEAADELEWMLKSGYGQGREGSPRVHRLVTKIRSLSAQPEQEPVAVVDGDVHNINVRLLPDGMDLKPDTKLYITPPQRKPWVSMTPEQVEQIRDDSSLNIGTHWDFYCAIEDKLRELNEATQRKLTDEEFLELLLRKGNAEVVGYCTFVGGSMQMQGRTGLLRSAKIIKEFVEDIYGIKE